MKTVLKALEGGLVVSCQPAAPLNLPEFVGALAEAAVMAGAVGIRVNGPADIAAVKARVNVPIIGIFKQRSPDYTVYITPDMPAATAVLDAGAEIVALDGSPAARPGGTTLAQLIAAVHGHGALVMADISTLDEGLYAADAGADIIASTLSGYTPHSPQLPGPDLDLIEQLAGRLSLPIIAEGRYYTPDEVAEAFKRGAFSVVVGRAITEPQLLTKKFAAATPRHHDHAPR